MINDEMLKTFRESLSRVDRKILETMDYGICIPTHRAVIRGAEDWDDASIYPSRKIVLDVSGRFGSMTVKIPSRERALETWERFCSPNGRRYSIRKDWFI